MIQKPLISVCLLLFLNRKTEKPLLWEVGKELAKVLVCLWGFANCAFLCLLDMARNAPHFWTFSLGAWSASYHCPFQIVSTIASRSPPPHAREEKTKMMPFKPAPLGPLRLPDAA
jgi:hypothetical protein